MTYEKLKEAMRVITDAPYKPWEIRVCPVYYKVRSKPLPWRFFDWLFPSREWMIPDDSFLKDKDGTVYTNPDTLREIDRILRLSQNHRRC